MADDDLDALLKLAEEADGDTMDCSAPPDQPAAIATTSAAAEEADPLLDLADALFSDDQPQSAAEHPVQQQTPTVNRTAAPAKPTLCSTRAFSTATPGSSSRPAAPHSSSATASKSAAGLPRQQPEVQHYVEKLTGLKIKLPRVSGVVLKERYRSVTCVPVSKAQHHMASDTSSWVVIAVLVSKQIGTTAKGAPYSRWRVSDLGGSDAQIALFGEAHKDHYSQAEGSVLAFYSPRFSNKGPGGSSSSNGLAVSQGAQIELLATSAGWGFCRGVTKTGSRCSNAVDTTVSHYCQYHALQQAKTLRAPVKGKQQQQQQQQAATPAPPAASNGKVFDARSKSWGTLPSRPQQQPAAAAAASRPVGGGVSRQSGSGGAVNAARSGGLGRRNTVTSAGGSGSSNYVSGSNGGSSGGATGRSGGSSGGSAGGLGSEHGKAAAAQAELRESLKAKMQQQQQQQQPGVQPPSSSSTQHRTATGGKGRAQAGGGSFNLLAVMAAVSAPDSEQQQQHLSPRLPPARQLRQGSHPQQQQQQQQGPTHLQQQQCQQPSQAQRHPSPHSLQQQQDQGQQQQQQQQQQHQQEGIDELLDDLFEDSDEDAADDLIIQPDTAHGGGGLLAQQPQQPQQQPGAAAATAAGGLGLGSAAARAASAMAQLSSRAAAAGSSGSNGGSTAAKLTEARKRMKVTLGMASKSTLNTKGTAGAKGGSAAAAAGSKGAASNRPHVSRIGAVGGATVGQSASAGARSSNSVVAAAMAAAGRSGGAAAAAAGGVGVGVSKGSGAAAGGASGFRAMFGRVLQRTDINKPDAKALGAVSDAAHASMMSKLLDQYEQKDNLAQQLEAITKLEVTAFECRTCKFLTEKRRATCSGHDVVPVRVTKRWWICEACGWKLHTLRELMPSKRCPKCRDPEKLFRPTSAYNAPKPVLVNANAAANPIACSEAMLPRGKEHAFCLNSLQE